MTAYTATYSPEYLERYTTEKLKADASADDAVIKGPRNRAIELLKLDTPERRARADNEGCILNNLEGGVPSRSLATAVLTLKRMIECGKEDEEMYGEKFNREFLEKERKIRGY